MQPPAYNNNNPNKFLFPFIAIIGLKCYERVKELRLGYSLNGLVLEIKVSKQCSFFVTSVMCTYYKLENAHNS